jgi:hypothetical protein
MEQNRALKSNVQLGFAVRNRLHACEGFDSMPGLPDFNLYNIPKRGEIYQFATKLPNGHKIYQMALYSEMVVEYENQFFSLQCPPRFPKIWIFGFENIQSGNPIRCQLQDDLIVHEVNGFD